MSFLKDITKVAAAAGCLYAGGSRNEGCRKSL